MDLRRRAQRRLLWTVLAINAGMFGVEAVAGVLLRSTALLADSLDMLGDALTYGVSLYAVGRGVRWAGRAALVKGVLMTLLGLGVLVEAFRRLADPATPVAFGMVGVAVLALVANVVCLRLLHPYRADDINMRSTWICSRVDVLANLGTILAGVLVWLLGRGWPDLLVALVVGGLVLKDSLGVLRDAWRTLREEREPSESVREEASAGGAATPPEW